MKKQILTVAGALTIGVASLFAVPAQAGPLTITNLNGTNSFSGFDWSSTGSAFTTGFAPSAGNVFTLTYFANAQAIYDGNGLPLFGAAVAGLDPVANGVAQAGYEYTVVATLTEQVIGCSGVGLFSCTFNVLNGGFNVYYDLAQNANRFTGTGFGDGTTIITGAVGFQNGGTFTADTATDGTGVSTITGAVTFTNLAFINPSLVSSTATTTLQIGAKTTNNWTAPSGFNGTAFNAGNIVFQADANQGFSNVPEPGSMALIGLGLLGLGATLRRRKN